MTNDEDTLAISGYEFAQKIIAGRDSDAIDILLNCTNDCESDYLELKAAVEVRPQDLNPGEQPADMYWNIAKEIIAMINTRGGLLVIGMEDRNDHRPTLRQSDTRHIIEREGFETYMREIVDAHVLPEDQKWRYKGRTYEIAGNKNLADYLELMHLTFRGEDVVAYLIKPCDPGDFVSVKVTHADGKPAPEELLRRLRGNIGECEALTDLSEILTHVKTRVIRDRLLSTKLERYLTLDLGTAMNTLPTRNALFSGRERELERLGELIDRKRIPILHGEGGTGKSELACEFAHRNKGRFGGGCLFVDMKGINSWPTALNRIYEHPHVRQALGPVPQSESVDRSSWIFHSLMKTLSRGNLLVILDNLDDDLALSRSEILNGPLAHYLSETRHVSLIATSRVIRHINPDDPGEIAVRFPLENLDENTAEEFLCKCLPEQLKGTPENRKAIRKIARLLDCHAWRMEKAGRLLACEYENYAPPPLQTFLSHLQKNHRTVSAGQKTFRGNALSVGDLLRPTIEALKNHASDKSGHQALELAKAIACFPHSGIIDAPLRLLWTALFNFPAEDTYGKDPLRVALRKLEQYALIGKIGDDRRIRMHQLTQDFFRNEYASSLFPDSSTFADAISKTLASDARCPIPYWADLAADSQLMAHCPWESLDAATCHDIVCNTPGYADRIDWSRLDGYDIADALSLHPKLISHVKSLDILYYQDRESPCSAFAVLLGGKLGETFADRCDFNRLSSRDIVHILTRQPSLAPHFTNAQSRLERRDWVNLISNQPQLLNDPLAQRCPWGKFRKTDWVRLISSRPSLADGQRFLAHHRLEDFSDAQWAYLLSRQPERFINHSACPRARIAADKRLTVLLLSTQPQLLSKVDQDGKHLLPFNLSNLTPAAWATILRLQPSLDKHCDKKLWSQLDGHLWTELLSVQPGFAGRCPFDKLDGNDWGQLLVSQPQLAKPEAWTKMAAQDHDAFFSPLVRVLYNHPELAETQVRDLSGLSQSGKRILLSQIPSLAQQISPDEFSPLEWARLVSTTSSFADLCPFERIPAIELAVILQMQPQLEPAIQSHVSDTVLKTARLFAERKVRVLALIDLLWHLDEARMTCDLQKAITFSANLAWAYFVLGLVEQARHYHGILEACLRLSHGEVAKNTRYTVADPLSVLPALRSMADVLALPANDSLTLTIPEKTTFVINRLAGSVRSELMFDALTSTAREQGLTLDLIDATDLASDATQNAIRQRAANGNRLVYIRFEELLPPHNRPADEFPELVDFHRQRSLLDRPIALQTLSPLYLQDLPKDIGLRLLNLLTA